MKKTDRNRPLSSPSPTPRAAVKGASAPDLLLHRLFGTALLLCLAMTFLPRLATAELEHAVSLNQHDTGALYVWGETATGARAEFLLDTGATMVTVTRAFFRELKRDARVEARGKVAARLANGSYQVMETYLVDGLRVGGTCEVGPVEVAVLPGKGRNILGLSALAAHAPFAVHLAPPKLALSGCAMGPVAGEALAATP